MNKSYEDVDENEADWPDHMAALAAALPRDRAPSRLLEERTVTALRKRGLIALRGSRRWALRRMATRVAASIALFALGVAAGQWLGARSTTNTVIALQHNDALRTAAEVQRAGTAYVAALQALARQSESNPSGQGREVALTALYAAANEMVRLAPNDPVAAEILRGFQRAWQQQSATQKQDPLRRIVWF